MSFFWEYFGRRGKLSVESGFVGDSFFTWQDLLILLGIFFGVRWRWGSGRWWMGCGRGRGR